MATAINEVGRFITKLPADATIYSSPVYVPVVFDQLDGRVHPSILTRGSKSLGYLAAYEVIGYLLCEDRAQRVVDRQLLLMGKAVTPERYLSAWRASVEGAGTPEDLYRAHGLALCATITAPIERLRGCKTSWSSSPFATFSQVEDRFRDALRAQDGRFELRLDLRAPQAARDAYYIAEMVSSACRGAEDVWTACLTVEGAATGIQASDLFVGSAEVEGA